MVGDTFKENATLRSDGVFYAFGVTPKLKSLYGVRQNEPIYEVEFEIVEEYPKYPKENSNEIVYYAYYDREHYSSVQPTAEMFAMQFPYDVWECQGKEKVKDNDGNIEYFGKVVRIKPISQLIITN